MPAYTYLPNEIEEIEQQYQQGEPLERLAEIYQKSVASIRMKLVKRGTYVAKAKTSTTSAKTSTTSAKTTTAKPAATKTEVLAAFKTAFNLVGAAQF